MSRVKKTFVICFIVTVLLLQIKANIGASFPYGIAPLRTFDSKVNYRISTVDWVLSQFSWLAGLSTRWRMFSPPPRSNWYYSVWAIDSEGVQSWVPLYGQGDRNFIERNFLDFREVKYHLNIYNKPAALNLLAQHLCGSFQRKNPSENAKEVQSIRIALVSRQTLPPDYHFLQQEFYDQQIVTEFGIYPCAESSMP
jgi:hypothetical protein